MRLEKDKGKSLSHGEEEDNHPGTRPLESPTAERVQGHEEAPPLKCVAASRPLLVRLPPGRETATFLLCPTWPFLGGRVGRECTSSPVSHKDPDSIASGLHPILTLINLNDLINLN